MDSIIVDGNYPNYASYENIMSTSRVLAASIGTNAVTDYICISPNGNSLDGKSWEGAFTTISEALDAASTDPNDCTLILISPHDTQYDIDTTGYPTWTGNYILQGSYRNWAKIINGHATASCIMKFTGKVALQSLNFNLGIQGDGIHMTHGGVFVDNCMFVGTNLTSAGTALYFIGSSSLKHIRANNLHIDGHTTHMTGLKVENVEHSVFCDIDYSDCLCGIHILDSSSTHNTFCRSGIADCVTGIYIQAGTSMHFTNIEFHGNTTRVTDATAGGHHYKNLFGNFSMDTEPNNLTGVTVTAHANADTWGTDTEVRAAATSTKPFRVVGYFILPVISQLHKLRFSSDGGSTYFDEVIINANKQYGMGAPAGTEYIFNKGTQIVASAKAETGGSDTLQVWLKIQEI